ncbi:MAG TPA: hypothetical protein PKA13_22010 [Geminicoccaceae bacterium]|nr:hypothetical protein [Geminicoccus sp.]HMU52469.1 hypothetical protein [Geminicoccaceae bacterium]
MDFEEEEVARPVEGERQDVPFFAVLLLALAERLGVTAGNGGFACGLDGWVIRLGRSVLLLTTPAGLWQPGTGTWSSWDAPTVEWQLLPFAGAPDAFEAAVAACGCDGQPIVTLATPILSLPDRGRDLATLLDRYAPPGGTDGWSHDNRQLYHGIAEALESLLADRAAPDRSAA